MRNRKNKAQKVIGIIIIVFVIIVGGGYFAASRGLSEMQELVINDVRPGK
jgi:uncharacterized protein YpmB